MAEYLKYPPQIHKAENRLSRLICLISPSCSFPGRNGTPTHSIKGFLTTRRIPSSVDSSRAQVGATVGCILAFLLGRFVLQEQAQGLFNKFKVLQAVNRAIKTQGLKLVILLRLSPVVPFSAFNYVM